MSREKLRMTSGQRTAEEGQHVPRAEAMGVHIIVRMGIWCHEGDGGAPWLRPEEPAQ